jgi:chromosome segregation ATPase
MTPSRYLFARIAQAFGYVRRTRRLTEAAAESHLLREAETYLGMAVWEDVEPIDALSVEYWNLRKLIKERDEVDRKVREYKQRLDEAHEERAALLNGTPEQNEELVAERGERLKQLEDLARERDMLVAEAREVRRLYMGTKTKLEVIKEERDGKPLRVEDLNEIEGITARLVEIRREFDELKQKRTEIGKKIEGGEHLLDEVDGKIAKLRQERRERAAQAFQVIGDMNKELSQLRAEAGVLEVRMRQMYSDIGRHVSLHAGGDPKCTAAARKQQALVAIMKALRNSVYLNQKLAGAGS